MVSAPSLAVAAGVQAPDLQLASRLQGRLGESQQQALLVNYALLLLAASRNDACQRVVSALVERWLPGRC